MIVFGGYLFAVSFLFSSLQCEAGVAKCSDQFSPYPGDCSKFYMCNNGDPIEIPCPPGTHWNNGIKTCDWPENANCQKTPSKPAPSSVNVPNESQTPNEPKIQNESNKPIAVNKIDTPNVPNTPEEPTNLNKTPSLGINSESNAIALPDDGEYKVVCYFSNWAWYRQDKGKFMPEDIDANLCTHIIYAFTVLDDASLTIKTHDPWADIDNKFYERVTAYRKRGIKVLIAIGGWNDSQGSKYGRLLLDQNARRNFITNAIAFIEKHNFDGLDLDLEYPACWQGNCEPSRAQEKEGFAQLVKELSEAFKPHGLLLSAAVSASKKVIDAAYDIPKLAQYLDWINLMTYDFHGHFDGRTGHVAPLYSNDKSDNLNCDFAVKYWIQGGLPSKKLVVGMPTYGQSFTLANAQNNGFNAPSNGPGEAGQFTKQGGILSYYEICDKIKNNGWNVIRDPQNRIGPYAFRNNQWVSFDDVENVRVKSEYVHNSNLGGGMIWALDFDDFSGICGYGNYPLLTTINQVLRGVGESNISNKIRDIQEQSI